MVNAAQFPGPALWQGLMLLALPLWLFAAFYKDGKYMNWASIGYGAFGVALMTGIIAS